jgi:hypothetical protein
VGQGDLPAAHGVVDLGSHHDAAGGGDDGDPAAGVDAQGGEIGGVDAQGPVGIALAPRRSPQDLVGVVGAALAVDE